MKIDWKARMKNPTFWVAVLSAIATPILAAAGVTVEQVSTWPLAIQIVKEGLANPFVVLSIVTAVLSILGIVVDPTTAGLGDKFKE